jgi:hypothetical protein
VVVIHVAKPNPARRFVAHVALFPRPTLSIPLHVHNVSHCILRVNAF